MGSDSIGSEEALGKMIAADHIPHITADNGFRIAFDPSGQNVDAAAAAPQFLSQRDAVGHEGRFRSGQEIGHLFRRRTGVEIDEVILLDQAGRILGDAAFITHMNGILVLQIFHIRFI